MGGMNPPKYSSPFTFDELHEALHYDPETGHIYWREYKVGLRDDMRADTRKKSGYRTVTYKDIEMRAHRVAWVLMTKEWPMFHLDHADRDITNNVWSNLRHATFQENHLNSGPRFGRHYKGVSKHGVRGWRATVQVGVYNTPEEAAKAYDDAVLKIFGDRAYCNFK
jgi:HNH endonuclease